MQPAMAELAVANAASNGFSSIRIITERIETAVLPDTFDHAMANPPYHHPEGSISPDADKETAKRAPAMLIRRWIERIGAALRYRGTLTLSVPAGLVPACLQAMAESRCPCTAILPLWPKIERPAKLVLLRGVKGARVPMQILPGLVLHRADGSYTDAAQAILRNGGALKLAP
jgi:tRNA1(Val) A37 N6-methylase TrmN6